MILNYLFWQGYLDLRTVLKVTLVRKKNTISLPNGHDDLGISGSVIAKLTRLVVEHVNQKLYFDK